MIINEYFLTVPFSCDVFDPLMQRASQLIKVVLKKNILESSTTSDTTITLSESSSHQDDNVFDVLRLLSSLRRTEIQDPKEIISLLLMWLSSPHCSEKTGLSILRVFVDWHKTIFSKSHQELEAPGLSASPQPPVASVSTSLTQLISPFLSFVKELFSWIHSFSSTSGVFLSPLHRPSAVHSLKVAAECPLIIVVLFQTYKKPMADLFVNGPLMMQFIDFLRIGFLDQQLANSESKSFPPELISVHVKILSLLTFMARAIPVSMKSFAPSFPKLLIILSGIIPDEAYGLKREVLIAFRHLMLTQDVRPYLVAKVSEFLDVSNCHLFNLFLDEDKNISSSLQSTSRALRPIILTTFADFIVQFRSEIPVSYFNGNLIPTFETLLELDPTRWSLSFGMRAVAARLLSTIVEHFVVGLPLSTHPQLTVPYRKEIYLRVFYSYCRAIHILSETRLCSSEETSVDNFRILLRALITGLKVLFFCLSFSSALIGPSSISNFLSQRHSP